MPCKCAINSVPAVGKAIPVKKVAKDDPAFDAEVDRVHALVISQLADMYARWAPEFGETRPLVIH